MDTRALLQHGFRYALSLTHDRADAEDLLQEAWARLLKAEGPRKKSYLFRVIRNAWVDRIRRDNIVQFVTTDEPERFEQLDDAELHAVNRDLLEQALAVLRPEEREALYLNAVEGYSATEIGALCDRPRNTVLSLMHRARRKVLAAFAGPAEKEVL